MNIFILKSSLLIYFSIIFTISCTDNASNKSKKDDANSTDDTLLNLNPTLSLADFSKPKVDASTLGITRLIIGKSIVNDVAVGNINFNYPATADYVEIETCEIQNDKKVCLASFRTIDRRIILKPFTNLAIVKITLKACVNPERALTTALCGPVSYSDEFTQWDNSNVRNLQLLQDKNTNTELILTYAEKTKKVLINFEEEVALCNKDKENALKIEIKRGIAKNFVNLGDLLLDKAFDAFATVHETTAVSKAPASPDPVAPASPDPTVAPAPVAAAVPVPVPAPAENMGEGTNVGALKEPLSKYEKKLATFTKYNDIVIKLAKARKKFDEAKPTSALQSLTSAVFDLFTAEDQTVKKCTAEEKAQREMKAIKEDVERLKERIVQINKEMEANK